MRLLLALPLVAALLLSADLMAAASGPAPVKVKVGEPNGTHFSDRHASVSLWLEHPKLALVRQTAKSTIDVFEDAKGNDLRRKPDRRGRGPIEGKPWLDDAHEWLVPLEGKAAAADAASVRVKGTLVFEVASKTKTARSKQVRLEPGATLEVGGYTFRVMTLMEQPDTPASSTARTVVLTTKTAPDGIAAVRFVDAEGKTIAYRDYGTGRGSMFGVTTFSLNHHLERIPETVAIELDLHDDLRELEVPFDVTQRVVR